MLQLGVSLWSQQAGETTPAVLSGLSLSAQVAGDVTLTYTIDKSSNVTGVWTSSNTKPTAAEVTGGTATDQIGSNFTELFDGNAVNTPLPSGYDGTAYLWLVPAGGTVVYPVSGSISTSFDTDAPTLSSPTATQTGGTTADWTVTSDEAKGTIYAAVRLSADPVLSITNIKNGTGDAVATSTDATPTADANNGGSFTGLTSGTAYKVDMYQDDGVAAGNESSVVSSAEFTTASGASPVTLETTETFVGTSTAVLTFSSVTLTTGRKLLMIGGESPDNVSWTPLSVDFASQTGLTLTGADGNNVWRPGCGSVIVDVTGDTGDIVITCATAGDRDCGLVVFDIDGWTFSEGAKGSSSNQDQSITGTGHANATVTTAIGNTVCGIGSVAGVNNTDFDLYDGPVSTGSSRKPLDIQGFFNGDGSSNPGVSYWAEEFSTAGSEDFYLVTVGSNANKRSGFRIVELEPV